MKCDFCLIVPISYDKGIALDQAARQAGISVGEVVEKAIDKVLTIAEEEATRRAPVEKPRTALGDLTG